jgi:hypothetical protein
MRKAITLKNPNGCSQLLLAALCLLSACGDRAVKTGIVYDSAVSNLAYQTDSFSGRTDDSGQFQYRPHEQVTFSVGAIQLGVLKGDNIITVLDLTDSDEVTDASVTNMARLLQSLDDDLDSSNGIQIPELAQTAAVTNLDFIQSTDAFAADASVQALMFAVKGSTELSVSVDVAQTHLQETLVSLGFNQAPTVTVSDAQTVTEEDEVILTATVADADGTITAISWQQVLEDDDLEVTLIPVTDDDDDTNDVSGLSVTFTAPAVDTTTILTFAFTATDDQGAETSVETQVTIEPEI